MPLTHQSWQAVGQSLIGKHGWISLADRLRDRLEAFLLALDPVEGEARVQQLAEQYTTPLQELHCEVLVEVLEGEEDWVSRRVGGCSRVRPVQLVGDHLVDEFAELSVLVVLLVGVVHVEDRPTPVVALLTDLPFDDGSQVEVLAPVSQLLEGQFLGAWSDADWLEAVHLVDHKVRAGVDHLVQALTFGLVLALALRVVANRLAPSGAASYFAVFDGPDAPEQCRHQEGDGEHQQHSPPVR